MVIFECIAEYRYWNRLIKKDKKIARWRGKWNDVSRKSYYLKQKFPDYCKERLADYCNGCALNSKDCCGYYSLVKKYRKNMAKCEKIRKKLKVLEKERF